MQSVISAPLTHEIKRTSFGYYLPSEIRKLSVKKITSPVAFDADGKPMPEYVCGLCFLSCSGLYDPALGPNDYHVKCPTCYRTFDVFVFEPSIIGRTALVILVILSWSFLSIIRTCLRC